MKNNKEIWKDILGYEGLYQVSNLGRVKSLDRVIPSGKGIDKNGNLMTTRVKGNYVAIADNGRGYKTVSLSKQGRKVFYVHRLVAQAFIPNPDNLPEVNHKDFDRGGNSVENLEWCTSSYNKIHSFENGRRENIITKQSNQVVDLETGVRYNTINYCAKQNNINKGTLKDGLIINGGIYKRKYLKLANGYLY